MVQGPCLVSLRQFKGTGTCSMVSPPPEQALGPPNTLSTPRRPPPERSTGGTEWPGSAGAWPGVDGLSVAQGPVAAGLAVGGFLAGVWPPHGSWPGTQPACPARTCVFPGAPGAGGGRGPLVRGRLRCGQRPVRLRIRPAPVLSFLADAHIAHAVGAVCWPFVCQTGCWAPTGRGGNLVPPPAQASQALARLGTPAPGPRPAFCRGFASPSLRTRQGAPAPTASPNCRGHWSGTSCCPRTQNSKAGPGLSARASRTFPAS